MAFGIDGHVARNQPFRGAFDVQQLGDDLALVFRTRGMDIAQPANLAFRIGRRLNDAARIQLEDAARAWRGTQELLQFGIVHSHAGQDGGNGVATLYPFFTNEFGGSIFLERHLLSEVR